MTENIQTFVNLIINKKFSTKLLFSDKPILMAKSEELVEPTKEFKGVMTDFVTNECLKTPEQQKKFANLIHSAFSTALKLYEQQKGLPANSIIFLFKGGNILRFVAYETMHELPGNVSDQIINYYKDSFKKSDADFTIYINPQLKNFDEVFEDINNLTFLLENNIRNEFLSNMSGYFEFYKLNNNEKKNILQSYLKKLNETQTLKDKLYDYDGQFTSLIFKDIAIPNDQYAYIPKADFQLDDHQTDPKHTVLTNLKLLHELEIPELVPIIDKQKQIYKNTLTQSEMYTSVNKTLTFKKGPNIASFSLIRIKMSLNAYFTSTNKKTEMIKLDGELIDISIVKKDDSNLAHFFEHKDKYISTYTIGHDKEAVKFQAYSLEYLLEDLERMLFIDTEFPWDDAKYAKRIKRIMFMYFIMLMINQTLNNEKRAKYMSLIKNNIIEQANKDHKQALKNIAIFLENSEENYPKIYPFRELVKNLALILMKNNLDKAKLDEYLKTINDNIEVLSKGFGGLDQYCKGNMTVQEASILDSTTLPVGGGFNILNFFRRIMDK
ncbi:hypothetical protein Klosneuvirus_4_5 [Klosneuvirus KNV1]|uniref:Uncharacterized protein n=1 Tax=Klosneuvirus KNV1 TaxID=1977640 RepID=A0A1V0SKD3_9VIRU|nr:hypothetical protein Klosneuvirus_4_5 [Klosneuvirus KNV1]